MDLTRSTMSAGAIKVGKSIPREGNDLRNDLRRLNSAALDRIAAAPPAETKHQSSGYGLPCAKCHLYYPANLDTCPTCKTNERVSPTVLPAVPKAQVAAEVVPDNALIEQEREAFLREFKSQLFAAHAEVANSPAVCALGEHHAQGAEAASICRQCYDRLQERVDICEAALHMDVKDAAQIVYDAVWADPSEPSKTYTNAASALLTELRKRAGVSSMIGPFQPLGN
ncbi:MAG: hypothetical protein WB523_08460 [Candidatus Sulfotelmatobacter sp.]